MRYPELALTILYRYLSLNRHGFDHYARMSENVADFAFLMLFLNDVDKYVLEESYEEYIQLCATVLRLLPLFLHSSCLSRHTSAGLLPELPVVFVVVNSEI